MISENDEEIGQNHRIKYMYNNKILLIIEIRSVAIQTYIQVCVPKDDQLL